MQLVDDVMETKSMQIHVQTYTWMCGKVEVGLKQPHLVLHSFHLWYLTHNQYEMISKLKLMPYVIGKCNLMVIQQDMKA